MTKKKIRYFIEASGLYLFFLLCRALPVDAASGLGGWIGRTIGPRLASSRKAVANLRAAIPELDDAAQARIIRGMWDNLGRVIAEYPHLRTIGKNRVRLEGIDQLEDIIREGKSFIFFSGHLGNWETAAAGIYMQHQFRVSLVYRAPNNPWTAKVLDRCRSCNGGLQTIAKSRRGARQIVEAIKDARNVGILIDQKYNEGVPVPFFDRPAMTSPAFVELAQKYDCALIPVRITRTKGAHFSVTAAPPLQHSDENGKPYPVETVIGQAHNLLESWIQEQPEQWLWLHRRWTKREKQYRNAA